MSALGFSLPDTGRALPRLLAATLMVALVGSLAMAVAGSPETAVRWIATLLSVAFMLLVAGVLAPVRLDRIATGRYAESIDLWRESTAGRLLARDGTVRLLAAAAVAAVVATIELGVVTWLGVEGGALWASCLAIAVSLFPIYAALLWWTSDGTPPRGAIATAFAATFPQIQPGAWLAARLANVPSIGADRAVVLSDRVIYALSGAAARTAAAVLARTAFAGAVLWVGRAIDAGQWWPLVTVAAAVLLVVLFSNATELLLGRADGLIAQRRELGAVHTDSEGRALSASDRESETDNV